MREQPASRGRLVGRYVVHDRIAAGGMATVHLGRLLGAAGFSRTVAIKRLHDAYAKDPDFVAMLLDEARLAAAIRHPNVMPTLDVVAEEDELLVVMEYVEGDSVAHLTKLTLNAGQRVPVPFAAAMLAQALHGLHAAHEARDKNGEPLGIVHRDVSPQNILVGVDGVARLLDFGIAKAASRATATEDGQLKGKTAYMAPEQLQHGAVDRRTDIFAASVVLWELLCGTRLFFADSASEMMARVLTSPIHSPLQHTPDLSAQLAAITMRGLERDPARRFATAEEMAIAIEESIPMPRSKDIGGWVATTARAVLEDRAQLVQTVEKSSHTMPVAARAGDSALTRAIEEAERRRNHAEMATDVGAVGGAGAPPRAPGDEHTSLATVQSTFHPVAVRPATPRAAIAMAIAGGSALVLAIGVAAVVARGGWTGKRDATGGTPPGAVTALDSRPVGTAPPPPSGQTLTSPSVVPASAAPTAPVPGSGTTVGTSPQPPATRLPPQPTAKPRNPCEIPWVIDANGQKHFKPECVH